MDKWRGWHAEEVIGMGIANCRPVFRLPIPKDLTDEQLKELEAFIDDYNAKLDMAEAEGVCFGGDSEEDRG